jgi:hypothetical protein
MPSRPPRSSRPSSPTVRRAALALALSAALPACASLPDEICEARCACTGCTDLERSACLADVTAEADTAEAYGCGEPYEASADCALTRSRCRDGRFFLDGLDCAVEAAELSECKARGSSLD